MKKNDNKKKNKKNKLEIINTISFTINDKNSKNIDIIELNIEDQEQKIGDKEFIKVLQKALKDALDKNDILRNYVSELNTENEKLKKENDKKDDVIKELGEYYELCQKNHINKLSHSKNKKKKKTKKKNDE